MAYDNEAIVRHAYHTAEGSVLNIAGFVGSFAEDGVINMGHSGRRAANGCGCVPCATWSPNSVSTPAWCTSPATRTPASRGSTRTPCGTRSEPSCNGVDIVVVADVMGHATLDTTRSYTRSSEADRARAIDQALIADE